MAGLLAGFGVLRGERGKICAGVDELTQAESCFEGIAFREPVGQGEQFPAQAVEFFPGLDGEDHFRIVEWGCFGAGLGQQDALIEETAEQVVDGQAQLWAEGLGQPELDLRLGGAFQGKMSEEEAELTDLVFHLGEVGFLAVGEGGQVADIIAQPFHEHLEEGASEVGEGDDGDEAVGEEGSVRLDGFEKGASFIAHRGGDALERRAPGLVLSGMVKGDGGESLGDVSTGAEQFGEAEG